MTGDEDGEGPVCGMPAAVPALAVGLVIVAVYAAVRLLG